MYIYFGKIYGYHISYYISSHIYNLSTPLNIVTHYLTPSPI
jgi:hypothetical protein